MQKIILIRNDFVFLKIAGAKALYNLSEILLQGRNIEDINFVK